MKKVFVIIKKILIGVVGLFVFLITWGIAGYDIPFLPDDAEITHEKPFSDFIGREYIAKVPIEVFAWNDFPDKEKILVLNLTPPSGQAKTRFVSYIIPLQRGQRIQILSAWRQFRLLDDNKYYYRVLIPGVDLPAGVPKEMEVESGGIPDPHFYEPVIQ